MLRALRSRLVLSNIVIALVGLLILVTVFVNLLVQSNTDVRKSDRAEQSRAIAGRVEALYRKGAPAAELERVVDMASQLLGARVIIVRPDGFYAVDSARRTPFFTGSWTRLDRRALRAARSARIPANDSDLVAFQSPIRGVHQSDGGAVLLVTQVKDVNPKPNALARVIVATVAAALLVWLLIGFFFTYSISRPLQRVISATERMARGDYNARVPTRGHSEISRLAASFNAMAEQVQHSNQVLKDFVANVSHDLRTPLTVIGGFSQALLDGTAGRAETESSALVIHDESLKMQHMVDDLLQLMRLESGLLKLDRHPVEVWPFVQSIVDRMVGSGHAENGPALRNAVPSGTSSIDADPVQLERALRNLLDNAIQHTPPDGTVTVAARTLGPRWIEISVADTGSGIPPEDLSRIFERFYRSDKSRERTHGHSGLGLAIVREIVEAHGGRVSVDSRAGSGTVFRMTLPCARAEAPVHRTEATQEVVTP